MSWIESHQKLKDEPKLFGLMGIMGWSKAEAIGRLHLLWWWCIDHADTGDLRKFKPEAIAIAMDLPPSLGNDLLKALTESGLLESKPYLRIPNWWKYSGRYLRGKYSRQPEAYLKIQSLYEPLDIQQVDTSSQAGSQQVGVPNLTIPTVPTKERKEKKETEAAQPLASPNPSPKPPPRQQPYKADTPLKKVICAWKLMNGFELDDRAWDKTNWKRHAPAAKELLEVFGGDWRKAIDCMEWVKKEMDKSKLSCSLQGVVLGRAHEYRVKVLGNEGGEVCNN